METSRQGQTGLLEKMEPRVLQELQNRSKWTRKQMTVAVGHSKGTRRSGKGCQKIPKVMFQFIVLLAVANATQAVPIMAELPVKVGPLPNNTGTYVELRNGIALMSAEWTIISYFDLRLLAQENTAFKQNIEELSTWCLRGCANHPDLLKDIPKDDQARTSISANSRMQQ